LNPAAAAAAAAAPSDGGGGEGDDGGARAKSCSGGGLEGGGVPFRLSSGAMTAAAAAAAAASLCARSRHLRIRQTVLSTGAARPRHVVLEVRFEAAPQDGELKRRPAQAKQTHKLLNSALRQVSAVQSKNQIFIQKRRRLRGVCRVAGRRRRRSSGRSVVSLRCQSAPLVL